MGCTIKIDPIYYKWFSQFAANDISAITPIYEHVKAFPEVLSSLLEISGMAKSAYKQQRLAQIEDEILSPYGLTWASFNSLGAGHLGDKDFEVTTAEIRKYDLGRSNAMGWF